jgi:3-deoxy-7-phosphoheptulonate synthase
MTMTSEQQKTVRPVFQPEDWSVSSWQSRTAEQQATYGDEAALQGALAELASLPPLVTSWEVNALREQLAEAEQGKRFLLQGGDCAETFSECRPEVVSNRLKVLLQMSLVLVHGLRLPVVRVGRFAGQYAKPRSDDFETLDGVTLPSYRGDLVNGAAFTAEARNPDPQRLLRGHASSAMIMNFVRGLIDGGFADLHHPEYWDLAWVEHSPLAAEYQHMVESVGQAVSFMETLAGRRVGALSRVDFYTSHEALHLPYEQAQTREVPRQWGWYNLSTHFPWIGMRTAQVDHAHLEFCRGIRNPIAVKVGPGMTAKWLSEIINTLNPKDESGRLTLIHRFGADQIEEHLPPLIEAARRTSKRFLWCCDPMHGNTEKTRAGVKTRRFGNVRSELEQAFDIHARCGSRLGGVHLELTGENVTECTGGARDLTEEDLSQAYKSTVDPRLNYEQSMELALLIVRKKSAITSGV